MEGLQSFVAGQEEDQEQEATLRPSLRFHGRGVTPTILKRKYEASGSNQEKGTTTNTSMLPSDVQSKLDEQASHLSSGLRSVVAKLKESNPTLVIPQNMFDSLMVSHLTDASMSGGKEIPNANATE
ncbi:unnamed protein product [Linum trigynum]|uniref:Uncharacterized protein n=1 Tax=Linum trigynum TaxID=586398 RepID=A0AAV2G6K6_9ROSI